MTRAREVRPACSKAHLELIALLQVPDQCPQDIADLIHDCLRSRAVERPTIKQAFNRIKHSAAVAAATSSYADGFMMP